MVRRALPPLVVSGIYRVRDVLAEPEWEYVPEGWARADGGWNVPAVPRAFLEKWPSYVRALEGAAPLGVSHEVLEGHEVTTHNWEAQNLLLSFAYVLARAARGRREVAVLDWGGALGHYALLARAVLPGVEVEYTSVDVPVVSEAARRVVRDATFDVDGGAWLERRYDVVLASDSLHYSEDWLGTLRKLASVARRFVYVTQLPVAFSSPSFVTLQRGHRYGYGTEFLGWVLNDAELKRGTASLGLTLLLELLAGPSWSVPRAPERLHPRGYLFAVPDGAEGDLEPPRGRTSSPPRGRRRVRSSVKALAPPLLVEAARWAFDRSWEPAPGGWAGASASAEVRPWPENGAMEVPTYRAQWPLLLRALAGTANLGVTLEVHRDSPPATDDLAAHNAAMAFAYVLALTSRGLSTLSMLDWGGGIGHYFLFARRILPELELTYVCKEMPALCALGRELLPAVEFCEDDSCLERRYDLVLASSSLQYAEHWPSLLEALARAANRALYVARLPVTSGGPSFVVRRRAARYGYQTAFVGWVLNRDEFLATASTLGLRLVREFVTNEWIRGRRLPAPFGSRGYLFVPAEPAMAP